MQKSQRPHIIAEHQWYKKENTQKNTKLKVIVIINISHHEKEKEKNFPILY